MNENVVALRSGVSHRSAPDWEHFYAAVFKSSDDAIITQTLDGTITSWNPAAESIFGFSAAEAVGQTVDIIVPPERRAEVRDILERLGRGETIDHHETVRVAKNGKALKISVSISPIRSASGEVIGAIKLARDIGGRKRAEEVFRLGVEAAASGMLIADHDGRIVTINKAVERLFGYSHDELIGQKVEMLMPARSALDHVGLRREFGAGSESRNMAVGRKVFGLRRDGSEFLLEVRLDKVPTGNLVLCTIDDVSDRLLVARLQDAFIVTVSHELRTPLTSIAGALGLLMNGAAGPLPATAARLVSIANSNIQRLVALVNDVFDMEKLQTGKIRFAFAPTDLHTAVVMAIEATRVAAERSDIRVRLDPGAATCVVRADLDRLVQVFVNLLSNAIKFSPVGQEVEVSIEQRNGTAWVGVRDHGLGVPDAFKPDIFRKFSQASSPPPTSGTGLGLSIVKQIVEQHGGEVGFASAAGGGTVFHVVLPLAGNDSLDSAVL
jgi:PAS domain S-box-containing protein